MNDHELRDRMRAATTDIRPQSRLGEIEGGATVVALTPRRRTPMLAVAALIVAVVLAGAVLVNLAGGSDGGTDLQAQAPPTSAVPDSSFSGAADPATTREGDRLSVLVSSLPPGMHLLDEATRLSEPGQIVARFGIDDSIWDGDGPYLRIVLHEQPGVGTMWSAVDHGEPVTKVGRRDAYLNAGESGSEVPDGGGGVDASWTTLTWSPGPDELVEIQAKGIDDDDVLWIAHRLRIQP